MRKNQTKNNPIPKIGHISQAPKYAQLPHIQNGYRINYSFLQSIKSLFHLHNQSINVWTHLVGAIIFLVILFYVCFYLSSFKFVDGFLQNYQNISNSTQQIFWKIKGINLKDALEMYQSSKQQIKKNLENFKQFIDNQSQQNVNQSYKKTHQFFDILQNYLNFIEQFLLEESQFLLQIMQSYQKQFQNQFIKIKNSTENLIYPSQNQTAVSRVPIVVFLITAIFCLFCSAIFHLLCNINEYIYKILHKLDFAGIIILITGNAFPPVYYGFYCSKYKIGFYLSIFILIGMTLFIMLMFSFMYQQRNNKIRVGLMAIFGIILGLPIFHLIYDQIQLNDGYKFSSSILTYILLGISYLGGLAIYSKRFPEKYFKNRFDILGSSHQIWHLCVILGIVFGYLGAVQNFNSRSENAQCSIS